MPSIEDELHREDEFRNTYLEYANPLLQQAYWRYKLHTIHIYAATVTLRSTYTSKFNLHTSPARLEAGRSMQRVYHAITRGYKLGISKITSPALS